MIPSWPTEHWDISRPPSETTVNSRQMQRRSSEEVDPVDPQPQPQRMMLAPQTVATRSQTEKVVQILREGYNQG